MRSLGLATDLLALRGIAQIERHPDHIVVRTLDQPDFWSGNLILSLRAPLSPEDEVARFRAAFPKASHVTVTWDDPHLDPDPLRGPWEALGADIGADDRDWAESFRVALTVGVGEGYEEASHRPFLQRRIGGRRAQARAGTLRWWGVFRGGDLAAQMGLVEGEVD